MTQANSSSTSSYPDIVAILPAAGIGSRMQADCPKQYLTIGQQTIIEYAIHALLSHTAVRQVIVALNPNDNTFAQLAVAQNPRVSVVIGGAERSDSVLAGLKQAKALQADWVLVHDAARPCLSYDDLDKLIQSVLLVKQGGILAMPVRDTMKRAIVDKSAIANTVDRNGLWHALTPQMFPLELLFECMVRAQQEGAVVTDEASALEHCGFHPLLVSGRSDNIKVTRPEDLALATFYLTHQ
ncbi:2-C-methyl-D-erythritol 4-phosphate cytidylyltransferase [Limnobaculum zhutongyuii]|uniref:2-C-methyl-D-erythritol 4-phosphate cytidylyltransferase n=1 Tax=Limnobaculum zhutongyuii TaxID=2498113 RepID=A0A411WLJ7_9GAMM|nr:2-C-methyl-D-erythritol 4-phosphate cytidylyltransferase [Limnobaculum zhutongyuii]QBH97094.1 2-C-methyl-D-erythritol 4-phosphate cytidylyltransferase [Limnobaculum zhutongyuii]TQS88353.1 2-C-methyl-D-erythritol 4-phosphate cytidylyltransferase [Limnobaculum zhutongyuii]